MKEKPVTPMLISAKDAAKILGVSAPTFAKIQKQYKIRRIKVGARYKYLKKDVINIIKLAQSSGANKVKLNVLSRNTIESIEIEKNVFDLRLIKESALDPYATLSILSELLHRSKELIRSNLIVDSSGLFGYLKAIGFFDELEAQCGDYVTWDKEAIKSVVAVGERILIPIKSVRMKGGERGIAESLLAEMKKQGFKADVRHYIGTILGELADNSLTHSAEVLGDRVCYFLIEKFVIGSQPCLVVGLADLGIGIHNSLRKNPKHSALDVKSAFLEAFRPFVSSWADVYCRGKGLTDLVTIAMGNHSHFRVDSSDLSLLMDFRNQERDDIVWSKPITARPGTRFGLLLIDKDFEAIGREQVDKVIKERIEKDGN